MIGKILRWILIFLLLFNAVGAFYGSYHLLTDPTGGSLQMPLAMLEGSPFKNYFLPGIILLLVNGFLPSVAAIGLIIGRPEKALPGFPFFQKRLWAWSLALMSGLGLMIWIGVQIAMISFGQVAAIQVVYGTLGLVITVLVVVAPVQEYFKIPK